MIDMHSHILPGVDDGAPDLDVALAMARAAVADGVSTMVATPHVDDRYGLDPPSIGEHVGRLNLALARAGVALAVLPGAEVAHTRAAALPDDSLRQACLGHGTALFVESPYQSVSFFDDLLFDLQVRGFRPVLAHPERCVMFQREPERLAALVDRGVFCSVNAGSLAGRFGRHAQKTAVTLVKQGLVHTIASDCHDQRRRPPGLTADLSAAEETVPGIGAQAEWLTNDAPAALLADKPLPPRPELPEASPSGWRRRIRRRRAEERR